MQDLAIGIAGFIVRIPGFHMAAHAHGGQFYAAVGCCGLGGIIGIRIFRAHTKANGHAKGYRQPQPAAWRG
ncbi:hypothetical protein AA0614_2402 [Komagataeibacter saccharivorans NRIC 0614]|nr:hypothetical protein AA0614_2402 [Komagataeibacter saccharivorans NRIC 0614]